MGVANAGPLATTKCVFLSFPAIKRVAVHRHAKFTPIEIGAKIWIFGDNGSVEIWCLKTGTSNIMFVICMLNNFGKAGRLLKITSVQAWQFCGRAGYGCRKGGFWIYVKIWNVSVIFSQNVPTCGCETSNERSTVSTIGVGNHSILTVNIN